MASTINASTTSTSGLVYNADASGILQLQSNGVTGLTVGTGGNVTVNTNLTVTTAFTTNVRSQTTNIPPIFQDSAGTEIGTLCRAWVKMSPTNTGAIVAGFNVSSITYLGTGQWRVNFTNPMPTVAFVGFITYDGNYNLTSGITAQTVNSATITSRTGGGTLYNPGALYIGFFA